MKKEYFKIRSNNRRDEYYHSVIRRNIKRIRLEKGLTQKALADLAELSREYICNIENETRKKHLTISTLGRIAKVLEVNITEMFKEN